MDVSGPDVPPGVTRGTPPLDCARLHSRGSPRPPTAENGNDMRVLFATFPLQSHLLFMVPLAWALRSAGHTVCVTGHPETAPFAAQAGLPFVSVGEPYKAWELMRRKEESGTAGSDRFVVRREHVSGGHTWEQAKEAQEGQVKLGDLIHGPTITDLTAFCRRWRPDLVIWDPMFPAAPIAAEVCGAAHARFLPGQDYSGWLREEFLRLNRARPSEEREDPVARWTGAWSSRYGVEFSETMLRGHFTIDMLPGWARLDAGPAPLEMRYLPYDGRAVVPDWLREEPRVPRVCLTLGITAPRHPIFPTASPEDLQQILDALADLPVEVVAAVRGRRRETLDLPGNVRLVDFAPLHALLPSCAAVIHPGGYNTFSGALYHGVPQLVLTPWSIFDSLLRAERLAEQGAGLLSGGAPVAENVRLNLLRLLEEPRFRTEARRLAEQARARPSPLQLLPTIEELAMRHRVPAARRG